MGGAANGGGRGKKSVAGARENSKALRWARERAVALRRAPLPWIAAAAVTVGLAVDGARRFAAAPEGPRALVARHPVPVGQPIGAIDFVARSLAETPPDALTDQDLHRLRGFRTVKEIAPGAVLVRSAVAPLEATPLGKRIPFGFRAYALDRGAGVPLDVGDRVDVFGGAERSVRVAENLLIVAVADDGTPVAAVPDPAVRVLEETRRRGGAVTVVLRRPDEPVRPKSRASGRPAVKIFVGDP